MQLEQTMKWGYFDIDDNIRPYYHVRIKLDLVKVFFQFLDQHIIDDIGFSNYETDAVPDQAISDLPAGILDFLDDFLLAADAHAHRLE